MGSSELYVICCLTTALFALFDVFMPVLREARQDGVQNTLTMNPKMSYFIYVCISGIIAPIILLPLLVPSMNIRFRQSLADLVNEEE